MRTRRDQLHSGWKSVFIGLFAVCFLAIASSESRIVYAQASPALKATLNEKIRALALLRKAGCYTDAYEKCLEIDNYTERVWGARSLQSATAKHFLGRALWEAGRFEQSAELYQKAYDLRLQYLGPGHKDTISTMLGLAESRMSNYEIGKAENILKEANRIFLVKGNGDSPQFFKLMILRAKALDEQDQNEKALSLLAETLSTLLKTADFYGEEWVLAMQAMGEVLIQMGRTEDAELALLAAEDIAERLGGSLHPYLTETLALLAWIHCKENRLAQTRRFAVRLESLAESKLGPDHYMAGWAQYWLGTVHMRRGELETGERYLRAALARLAELPTKGGAFRRYAVGMIAEADEERNDFEEAEKGWLSLLPMIQKTRATQKQKELAYALSHLIRVYKKLGRPGEAAKYEKRLEAIEARSQSLKDTTDQSRPQERPVTPHNTRQRTQDPGNSLREDLHQSMPDQHNPIDSRITRFKVVGSPCDVPFAVNATDNAGGIAGVSYPTCKSIRRLKYGPSRHATPPIHRTQRSQENDGWEADPRYWPRDNDSEEEAGYFLRDVTTNGGVRLR